jgi:hypothetical protein
MKESKGKEKALNSELYEVDEDEDKGVLKTFEKKTTKLIDGLMDGILDMDANILLVGLLFIVVVICIGVFMASGKKTVAERWEKISESEIISVNCTYDGAAMVQTQEKAPKKDNSPFSGSTYAYDYTMLLTDDKGNQAEFEIDRDAYFALSAYRKGAAVTLEYGGKTLSGTRLYRCTLGGKVYYPEYLGKTDTKAETATTEVATE